jgi:hypothetical protein
MRALVCSPLSQSEKLSYGRKTRSRENAIGRNPSLFAILDCFQFFTNRSCRISYLVHHA